MGNEIGESLKSIALRNDNLAWAFVYCALKAGAELVYHSKIKRYATKCADPLDELNGITISAEFIKFQASTKHGCLRRTGIDTYGIEPSRLEEETPKPRTEQQQALF